MNLLTNQDLLSELRSQGVELRSQGGRLLFSPAELPPETLAILREHKAELLTLLCSSLGAPTPTKPPPATPRIGVTSSAEPEIGGSAGGNETTYAAREARRFLAVATPRPDRRAALYDPGILTAAAAAALARGFSPEAPSRGGGAREPGLLPRLYAKPGGGVETFAQRAERRLAECGGLPPGARRRGAPVS